MIKIVREPSDTPNIQNTDDFVGLRYSYGDYNGYVDNKGQMLAYQINGSTFKVLSGRAVVNGVEIDIDANGASITIDNVAQIQNHSLYLLVNLATMKATLQDVIGEEVPVSDDLTVNTSGVAYLLLYTFSSVSGIIKNIQKKIEKIVNLKDVVNGNTRVAKAYSAELCNEAAHAHRAFTTDFSYSEWTTVDVKVTPNPKPSKLFSSSGVYEIEAIHKNVSTFRYGPVLYEYSPDIARQITLYATYDIPSGSFVFIRLYVTDTYGVQMTEEIYNISTKEYTQTKLNFRYRQIN